MPEPSPRTAPQTTARVFLELRQALADSAFLRRYIYTQESARFLGSTYKYGIHLKVRVQERALIRHLCRSAGAETTNELQTFLARRLIPSLPTEFVTTVDVPSSVPTDQAGDQCRDLAEQSITRELPASLPYAHYFMELTRMAARRDARCVTPARVEEFSAYLGHCHRNTMAKARHRHPELWDKTRGHYVLDSRGTSFAIHFVQQLLRQKLLNQGTRFLDFGSGIGTMIATVHYYSPAHATGIEQHPGLNRLAHCLLRKLSRLKAYSPARVSLKTGNAFQPEVIDLSRYDLCYVYSPLGIDVITADAVLERLRVGAVLISNRRPRRFHDRVEILPEIGGIAAYRKVAP
ncbi:MAG TPA: hypothetical protein DCE55_14500 [Planctomycetaceae bacterium]|nr:hypothetical protein [Planctomycetaceae bacterium]|tara:strand:+ start:2351 stop:3394 length:1044 start_codon:yes stop_codon:yes gene_type:complete